MSRLTVLAKRPTAATEGVEDGFGRVAEPLRQLGALGDEPQPMGGGLQNAEAVVVLEGKASQLIVRANPDIEKARSGAW